MPTTTTLPRPGTYLEATDKSGRYVTVREMPQYMRPTPGMFLVEWSHTGCMAFAILTGKSRTYDRWCRRPTAVLFDIDTVADDDGVLWGDPGARKPLTWYECDRHVPATYEGQ
jgi:hypothetical protein